MEIKFMRKVDNFGTLKAFFEVHTPKFIIRDCKLVMSKEGVLFASMPSKEYTDRKTNQKKWQGIISITDEDLRNKITDLAREAYGPVSEPESEAPTDDIPF